MDFSYFCNLWDKLQSVPNDISVKADFGSIYRINGDCYSPPVYFLHMVRLFAERFINFFFYIFVRIPNFSALMTMMILAMPISGIVPILFDAFLFAHEFSHMEFGLPDQYKLDQFDPPCPNYIMGRSGDSNGEITPNFSNRWVSISSHCAINLPSGWISDFEYILSTHPEFLAIYYFANDSGDPSPQNLFDFLSITEATY